VIELFIGAILLTVYGIGYAIGYQAAMTWNIEYDRKARERRGKPD